MVRTQQVKALPNLNVALKACIKLLGAIAKGQPGGRHGQSLRQLRDEIDTGYALAALDAVRGVVGYPR